MAGKIIKYDGDEFKSIAVIPEYAKWPNIYVAKTPHVDETGRSYQVINTNWGFKNKTHQIYDNPVRDGYHQVNLPRVNGRKGAAYVHRLVFLTWQDALPVNYQEMEINHLDETRDNNCFYNLEMISHQDNVNYGSHNQRVADNNVKYGPSANMVAINIKTRQDFHFANGTECARHLGLKEPHVSDCLLGVRNQHHGFVFCHEEEYTPAKVDELIAAATQRKTKN